VTDTQGMEVRRRDSCRLCGSSRLVQVLSLTPTPPANAFVDIDGLGREQATFPLDLFFCEDCAHVQLLDIVNPRILFENYVYVSGTSPVFVRHFELYAKTLLKTFSPPDRSLAVDIGSNDGTLLQFFKSAGLSVLGIDPAKDIARRATDAGIETLPEFFDRKLARQIREYRGAASVITANNMFAHADDLGQIVDGVRELLADDGVFVFEVSYLRDVYEKTLFDTIYHEHLSYHTVKPLIPFFSDHDMELIAVQLVDTHGGSLRGISQRKGGAHEIDSSVSDFVEKEEELGLDTQRTFIDFGQRIVGLRDELAALLNGLKASGSSIAGYGAPAKATTLMYHFNLNLDVIDFIVDDSPLKQGLYSPGLHIPVLPSSALADRRPDFLLILAWNFAEPIMRNNAGFVDQGGRFIVPIPEIKIIPSDQTLH